MNEIGSVLLALLITITILACSQQPSSHVPDLLDRGARIQLDKEWETIQNAYSKNKIAVQQNAEDHNSKLNLAYIFIQEARVTGEHGHYYPAALTVLDDILDAKKIDRDLRFRALATKAGVQLSLHEFAAAKKTADDALALNAHNAQIYGVLTDANVELGNYKEAVAASDRMIAIKPDLRSYARISYLREIHGDIEGAMKAFKLAIEAGVPGYEDRAWAMQTLGDILLKYDRPQEARAIYEQILSERSDYPFAVGGLADVAYYNGDLKSAEAYYKDAADIIPEVGFYINLAKIYKDQNRKDELTAILPEIEVMLKDDVDHGHNMNLEYASLYLNLYEDIDQALAYAKVEHAKRPQNIDVNKMVAEVLIANDKIEDALPYVLAASKTNSKDPDIIKLKSKYEAGQLSAAF